MQDAALEIDREVLTTFEAARICRVNPYSIRNWIEGGRLKAYRTPGGHRRIYRQDLTQFMEQYRMPSLEEGGGEGRRVLVVDDESTIIQYFIEVIYDLEQGIQVETATNGFDAGLMVHSFRPQLVFLDLRMPGLDGFAVCRKIKENRETASVKVVAMTGYYTDEVAERICGSGAIYCLPKPVEIQTIESIVGETFERPLAAVARACE